MKKQISILGLTLLLGIDCIAQITFEKGYFISDSGQRTECMIRNVDWENNPTDFEYRLPGSDIMQKADIQSVAEFGIDNVSAYRRAIVQMDRSGDNINSISSSKEPLFREETLFLRVLVDGKASLYHYAERNLERFFFEVDDSGITQLVYKRYLADGNIAGNFQFRQQIFQRMRCQGIEMNDVAVIGYNRKDLVHHFVEFNKCAEEVFVDYDSREKTDLFNLTVRPGINYSSLEINNSESYSDISDLGDCISFRFGIEAEFILPFNKNKWSLTAEPVSQYFKSETFHETDDVAGGSVIVKANYRSFEINAGFRHYFFLSDNSAIYAGISYIRDIDNNSTLDFLRTDGTIHNSLDITSRGSWSFRLGYSHSGRYSVEVRYQTPREILGEYMYWDSEYKTLSLTFGYSVL